MAVWRKQRRSSLLIVALGLTVAGVSYAAGQGTTTGFASFYGKGEAKEHKPGLIVWSGGFVGASVSDGRKGPLHNSGWDCTGETAIQDGKVHRSGGFCLVTDPDGDTINLVWERTDVPGGMVDGKTRGTYLSGTGKYAGIQGSYTFSCRLQGAMAACNITGGEYKFP
jgi:hypothetical protein